MWVNERAARGGKDEEDTIEIKEKAKAFFSTQNRCVTKEDYEARVLNIPAKFGNIAKAYVTRNVRSDNIDEIQTNLFGVKQSLETELDGIIGELASGQDAAPAVVALTNFRNNYLPQITSVDLSPFNLATINIHLLGYNNLKQLVGNPNTITTKTNDNLPNTLLTNIKNYLENFKILTDIITINDGYIVNFGVIFDVIAEKYADKQQVKLNCIQKIKDYFRIEKMQFNQPIYKSRLEFELMGVEGVRSIGHVTITQKDDYNSDVADADLPNSTFTYSFSENTGIDTNGDGVNDPGYIVADGGTSGYGYKYDFENSLSTDGTIIVPPLVSTPTVFELKNPNENIQGRVR